MKQILFFGTLALLIVLIVLAVSPAGISYAVGPYSVSADTYTDKNNINTTHGSDTNLLLSASNLAGCVETTYVWIKVQLPNPDAVINSAMLSVPLSAVGVGNFDMELRTIADVDFGWDEATLKWNGQPALTELLATVPNPTPGTEAVFLGSTLASYLNTHKGQEVTLVIRANCAGSISVASVRSIQAKEHAQGSDVQLNLYGPTAIKLQRFGLADDSGTSLSLLILSLALGAIWLVIYIYRRKAVG